MEKKCNRFLKIYPWFYGSSDLILWVVISTMFLTYEKGLSASEIVFMDLFSSIFIIIFRKLFLLIISKIGNINSVRLGSLMLLISSIIFIFGNYPLLILATLLYLSAFCFRNMENISLRNNLIYLNREHEYIKYKNKGFLIYSIITTIAVVIAMSLFNVNYYLPLLVNSIICFISFLLSFFLEEVPIKKEEKQKVHSKTKIKASHFIIILTLLYAIIRPTMSIAQSQSQLFIQYDLSIFFNESKVVVYLGIILFFSRVVRIISSLTFTKIYNKLGNKLCVLIPIALFGIFVTLIIGHYLNFSIITKFIVMGTAFGILIYIRDPFIAITQELLLKNSSPKQQQDGLMLFSSTYEVSSLSITLCCYLILLKLPLVFSISFLALLSLIGIIISFKVYKKL